MTLKLVSIEGETVPDPALADELQELADNIETDAHGVISVVVLADGNLRITWAGNDFSSAELIGYFEMAKFQVIADDMADD